MGAVFFGLAFTNEPLEITFRDSRITPACGHTHLAGAMAGSRQTTH